MKKISCIVGCKNSQVDIRDCLESIKWVGEIVIVDDMSTDGTVNICRRYTQKIFLMTAKVVSTYCLIR